MSTTIPTLPAGVIEPAKVYPRPAEHHAAAPPPSTALSPTDVSYVESLMGAIPAQKMEEILLRTGIPIPANLGPNIDISA